MSAPTNVDMNGGLVPPREAEMRATTAKANGQVNVAIEKPANDTPPPHPLRWLGCIGLGVFVDGVKQLTDEAINYGVEIKHLEFLRAQTTLRTCGLSLRVVEDWARVVKPRRLARERDDAESAAAQSQRAPVQGWRAKLRERKGEVCASFGNLCIILENTYADRLAFDEMANVPCLDGRSFRDLDISNMRCDLETFEGLEFSEADIRAAVVKVGATARTFHPVRDYLRGLPEWDGVKRIDRVAAEYLGADDSLSATLVRRFYIAAVKRALEPGCKVDNCLVLTGDEALKKSTYFRVLGGGHFEDSRVDITDRKGMMLMHSAWIYEWAEVDRMLEKKHDSDVKAFVSQEHDSFVPMFGRAVTKLLRSSITVGTSNKEKFIESATGDRRWWVVTVTKRIDTAKLARERDQLWAEAVHYADAFTREQANGMEDDENPHRWWLTPEEDVARAERNQEHLAVNPDTENVEAWLAGEAICCPYCKGTGDGQGTDRDGHRYPCRECNGAKHLQRDELKTFEGIAYVTIRDVLAGALGVPLMLFDANKGRAANALRRLGWRSGKRIRPNGRDGARVVPYYSPTDLAERDAMRGES